MASGLVLVIEDDEWVSRLLSSAIRDAGYDVLASATAKDGFEVACAEEPSCIICDVELPDGDGFWVARSIRTQDSRVAVTPFIFLSGLEDPESRMEGYQVGGDIYITKPFRIQEVVAHIGPLVEMAERMRRQREAAEEPAPADGSAGDVSIDVDVSLSEPPPPPPNEAAISDDREGAKDAAPAKVSAIEGDLSQMSIATMLTVLEMERRTGLFEVVSKKRRANLEIAAGTVVQGTVGGTRVSALTTLRTMLGWTVGRFSFTPMQPREAPANRKTIGAFLLEAVRLEDEAMRDELELPPSRRLPGGKLSAPALGGPASTADDLAPVSSRAMSWNPPSVAVPTPRPAAQAGSGASAAPARAQARASSEPPPTVKQDPDAVPMSQAQATIELDLDPISVRPAAGSPIFPGLASITGTHKNPKPASKPVPIVAPKAPPLPAKSVPPPAPRPASAPPPLPKRDASTGSAPRVATPPPLPRPAGKPATPPPLPPNARPAPPPLPRPENPPKKR